MVVAPVAGLDFPLKVLVWADGKGAVSVSYNSPEFLAERHHIEVSCVHRSTPLNRSSRQRSFPNLR